MRAADVIASRLYAAGCRYAFCIPGGEVLSIIDALQRSGIQVVLAKHENAAGFMAEGTYHSTGAPGILVATVGPGIANAVDTIANAYLEHVPLIVISGCIDPLEQLGYTHQVFDHQALLRPVCKASFKAIAGGCDIIADKAIAIATDGRPGPVHIDLPIAVAASEHDPSARVMRRPLAPAAPAKGVDLDDARMMFAGAERPLILVGVDALNQPGAKNAIRSFVYRHQVPVVTTYKAKGIINESDDLSLGGHGLSPRSDKVILKVLAHADFVLCAGYDPIEMRAGWRDPWDPKRAIEFFAEPNTHYMHQARHSWVCSIAEGLNALVDVERMTAPWPGSEVADARAELSDLFAAGDLWGPAKAIEVLRSACPEGTVLTLDSGAHRILTSQMWTCADPQTLLQSTCLCTMGCAVPLAAGYKLASPDRPVVALLGDACLDMSLGELITLRNMNIPVVIVVFVDGSLSLIEMKQRSSGFLNLAVDFLTTDYAAIAVACGGTGVTVSDPVTLSNAVGRALKSETFTLIAVKLPRRAYDGLI